jgi:predicted permease
MMIESVVLALLAGSAGMVLAFGGIRVVRGLAMTLPRMDLGTWTSFPRLDELGIDGPALAFSVVVAILAGVIFGIATAIPSSRPASTEMLRSSAAGDPGFRLGRRSSTTGFLVMVEVALAMVLLIGGGLLIRGFVGLLAVDPGYDASHVLTFQIVTPRDRYRGDQLKAFVEDVAAGLTRVPGVTHSAYATQLPMVSLLRNSAWFRRTPAVPVPPPSQQEDADARFVSRDYLRAMGIRVTAGRGFENSDNAGPRVVLINRMLAKRYYPGEDPIGKPAYLLRDPQPWLIVGIVEDVRQAGLHEAPEPQVFVDIQRWPGVPPGFGFLRYFAVRTTGDPASVVANVRTNVRQLDPQAAVYNVAPMEKIVLNSLARHRLYAVMVGLFGGVAVTLAAVGLYGLLAYSVAQRTREIGIRVALGGSAREIMTLVVRQGVAVTLLGTLIGGAGGVVLTRYLTGMLFGLPPLDASMLIALTVGFLVVALAASFVPARRAMRVDPLVALRWE